MKFTIPNHHESGIIKIYQELTHDVLPQIPRTYLDDSPKTVGTMRTWLKQMQNLLDAWESYVERELHESLLGIRIEITINGAHTVDNAYNICIAFDVLDTQGIEFFLTGPVVRILH